jgi:pimeloyl-ACP methyl ester carboxylesterase
MPELRDIETNGIRLRVAEAGPASGEVVLLLHGWPESWYSWRHQIPALAEAGYHVLAPDMRGFGGSDAPTSVEAYAIQEIVGDVTGLLDALGAERGTVIGHDWGSLVAWQTALLAEDRVRAVGGLSVPYVGRGPRSPLEGWRAQFGENFFYILYFQQEGVAEAEFDADPLGILLRLYASTSDATTGSPAGDPPITDPRMSAGGMIGRIAEPKALPGWLSDEDLDYYVAEFTRAGFRGGINYYRNFHRNWETTPELATKPVAQPALFLAGAQDVVVSWFPSNLDGLMRRAVPDLRSFTLIDGSGHWVQQERPAEVNAALLAFLGGLD